VATGIWTDEESRELKLDHCFAELLDAACAHGGAIADEAQRPCDCHSDRPSRSRS